MPASIKHLTDKRLNLTSLLAKWTDGLYYTAAIVRCDKTNKKCLVCFEDGSEVWVNNRDIHIQLTLDQLNEDEDIVCCICDDGFSEPPNEIILCDVCQQGYHQKCHSPPVDSSSLDESEDTSDHKDWFCATCSYILNQSNRAKLSADAQQQQQQQQQAKPQQSLPKQDPLQSPQPKPHQSPQPKPQQSPQPKPQQSPQPKPQQSPQPKTQQAPPQKSQQSEQSKSQQQQSQSQQQVSLQPTQKSPTKSKPQSTAPQVLPQPPSSTGPVKTPINNVQKPAPYYPLSNQARAVATSSTAALASMTASSALVVGGSAGRTKQDLVNQSNRSSQRQRPSASNVEVTSLPVKHAVRKSSVNFAIPVRQSALPTATRSVLPNTPPTPPKVPNLIATTATIQPQPVITTINQLLFLESPVSQNSNSSTNNKSNNTDGARDKQLHQAPVISQAPPSKKHATWTTSTHGLVNTSVVQTIKASDRPKDPPPVTPNFNATSNNSCKQATIVESTVSVSSTSAASSSHPSRDAGSSSIIVTAKSPQPTVIVSVESKQTGQKLT